MSHSLPAQETSVSTIEEPDHHQRHESALQAAHHASHQTTHQHHQHSSHAHHHNHHHHGHHHDHSDQKAEDFIGPQPINKENEREINKQVAVHEFEEFIEKRGGADADTEKQYEDPLSSKAHQLDHILHQHNVNDIGYKEQDLADWTIDKRGAASKEVAENFEGFNMRRHTYEGANLADQSPVRGEEEKWSHDPILHSIDERVAEGRKRRENMVEEKRKERATNPEEMEKASLEVDVPNRELAIPPEDAYPSKTDANIAPDMDNVDPY